MKLINYSFLKKEKQIKEKGLILKDGDIIHITTAKQLNSEIIISCKNQKLTIGEKMYKQKKDNLD